MRFLFLGFIFSALLWVSSASAVSITPLRQTIVLDPGSTEVLELTIKSDEAAPASFAASVEAFGIDEKTGVAIFDKEDIATDWITPRQKEVMVAPGKEATIQFDVNIPRQAEPHSHYVALFAEGKSSEGQIGVSTRLGSLVYLHIAGPIRENAGLEFFRADGASFNNSPIAHMRMENTGSIHLIPQGEIVLKDWFGKTVAVYPMNPTDRKVLPGESWDQSYVFTDLPGKPFGKLSLDMKLAYGSGGQVLSAEEYVWYVPTWFIISTFVGSFITLLLLMIGVRAYRHR